MKSFIFSFSYLYLISNLLNECLFTMMHHIAGDIHASDSLIEPSVLKSFSSILKEDIELEPVSMFDYS